MINYDKLWLQAAMMYDGEVVMIAMAATALLVIALTLFAFQVLPIFLATFDIQMRTVSDQDWFHNVRRHPLLRPLCLRPLRPAHGNPPPHGRQHRAPPPRLLWHRGPHLLNLSHLRYSGAQLFVCFVCVQMCTDDSSYLKKKWSVLVVFFGPLWFKWPHSYPKYEVWSKITCF